MKNKELLKEIDFKIVRNSVEFKHKTNFLEESLARIKAQEMILNRHVESIRISPRVDHNSRGFSEFEITGVLKDFVDLIKDLIKSTFKEEK